MRVPNGFCIIRPDGMIVRSTNSFLGMIGYERQDIAREKRFSDLIDEDSERKKFDIHFLDARRKGDIDDIEFVLKKFDGTRFPVSIDLHSINSTDGEPRAVRARVEDISYIKNREKHLVRSRDAYFNMLKDLHSSLAETRELLDELIYAFANAIDAKSHWTLGHSERVAEYSVEIAKEMGMDKKNVDNLKTAALLHDIGKIGTYDEILDKPQELTPSEYELVKKHPLKGITILEPIKKMGMILPIIIHHHERMDGTGYPDGLKTEEIPLLARILSVADSYDSMTAERPYRTSLGKEHAVDELKRSSGTQFDPEVIKAFLRVVEKRQPA